MTFAQFVLLTVWIVLVSTLVWYALEAITNRRSR